MPSSYPVLTFTGPGGPVWNDGVAVDGEGGSPDLVSKIIQIGLVGTSPDTPIEWKDNQELSNPSNPFSGLTTFDLDYLNSGWPGFFVKSADSTAFQINQFQWYDYGWSGGVVTVAGYLGGQFINSSQFTANSNASIVTVNLGSEFDRVDEVRITYGAVQGWGPSTTW
jgi:hypothetical protein